jgi:adenine-specific DNA-methyltransferase
VGDRGGEGDRMRLKLKIDRSTSLSEFTDLQRIHFSSRVDVKQQSALGQFLTPAPIARLMAEQFRSPIGHIRLLDPGAGMGALSTAFVERLLRNSDPIQSCSITAYEVDPIFISHLSQRLTECCTALEEKGIRANFFLHEQSFIEDSDNLNLPLFSTSNPKFTHVILNPPYKKINSQSSEKTILSSLGIETVNLYSAFVWLAMGQLDDDGEMVAITPRSFCNGSYFRPFRKALLQQMRFENIHLFESRSTSFSDDSVLQENIIFHAIKTLIKSDSLSLFNHSGDLSEGVAEVRHVPYEEVVKIHDSEQFIHLVINPFEEALSVQMEKFPCSLEDLGLSISTGPVVDFRLKSALSMELNETSVPLIYPESLQSGKVIFPPENPRKPIAIEHNQETHKWLIPNGFYVLVKRFSSKEEKRRVVAAPCPPIDYPFLGLENHLNYYHAHGSGLDPDLARGLTAFLNSTLFDRYFRQFSGHTQINATDLRRIKYPNQADLIQLGKQVGDSIYTQDSLDNIVHQTLSIMSEATHTIQAGKRIQEALAILRAISAPKEQQNERSALCVLALANVRPETLWAEATDPRRGITEMMDWFRDCYGKQYAPNTRETIRRQTMHQLLQMGFVVENPDRPDRPINSPKWCYQLHPQALKLLQSYGTEAWDDEYKQYSSMTKNILKQRSRSISKIPVNLPNGQAIELSSDGQNLLIKDVMEKFCPRFTPGGTVLYIGDAGKKFIVNESDRFQAIGVELNPHGKMPDLVVHYEVQDWLVLVEAVTSHGPVNLKRRNELKALFQSSRKGLVFVTAFPSRKDMTRYLAEISWETEVWVADQPDHLIHFNGERFLGPYEEA